MEDEKGRRLYRNLTTRTNNKSKRVMIASAGGNPGPFPDDIAL